MNFLQKFITSVVLANLKERAVSGAVWVTIEKIVRQVVTFVFGIILARWLSPSDYGVVGMLAIFLAIASTFMDSGMGSALIQKQDRTESDFSTVFYFNIIVSVFCYVLISVFAPMIAEFYKIPILRDVTRVVAASLIINAFATIHLTRLTIELKFREQSIISVSSVLVTGFVGLMLAYKGFGVWALVFQTLSGALMTAILTVCYTKWIPSAKFSKESFRNLFGYGSRILGSSLINTVYNNIYALVIGRVFSPSQVGYYNRGCQFAALPTHTVQEMALKVNFPLLSTIQNDDDGLLSAYKKLVVFPMYLLYPVLIGLAIIAEPLVIVLIGEKWLPCVPIIQILCIGNMFSPLTNINLSLLYVKARTDLVLKLELIKKPIAFAILFFSMPFGIIWMVIGKAIYEFIAFSFNCYYTGKILNYGEWKQLVVLWPIVFNSLIMGIIVKIAILPFDNPWWKLAIGIVSGIISYLVLSFVTGSPTLSEIVGIINRRGASVINKIHHQ